MKKKLFRQIILLFALSVILSVACSSLHDKSAFFNSSNQPTNNTSAVNPGISNSPAVQKVTVNISPEYLGMSLNEVINIEGAANERAVYDGGKVVHLHYFSKGITFCFSKEVLTSVIYYSGIAGGYETGRFAYNTRPVAAPVNNSLRFSQVISLLGQPAEHIPFPYAPIPSFKAVYPSQGLTFEFMTSTQQMICVEIFPGK